MTQRRGLFSGFMLAGTTTVLLWMTSVVVLIVVSASSVPDTPTHPDAWISRGHQEDKGRRSPAYYSERNPRARLEGQVSREIRETFGEEFCTQLEEESEVVRRVHEQRARIGREAGCSSTSPLSSSVSGGVLGDLPLLPEAMGQGEEEGNVGNDGVGGPMSDWLRY